MKTGFHIQSFEFVNNFSLLPIAFKVWKPVLYVNNFSQRSYLNRKTGFEVASTNEWQRSFIDFMVKTIRLFFFLGKKKSSKLFFLFFVCFFFFKTEFLLRAIFCGSTKNVELHSWTFFCWFAKTQISKSLNWWLKIRDEFSPQNRLVIRLFNRLAGQN